MRSSSIAALTALAFLGLPASRTAPVLSSSSSEKSAEEELGGVWQGVHARTRSPPQHSPTVLSTTATRDFVLHFGLRREADLSTLTRQHRWRRRKQEEYSAAGNELQSSSSSGGASSAHAPKRNPEALSKKGFAKRLRTMRARYTELTGVPQGVVPGRESVRYREPKPLMGHTEDVEAAFLAAAQRGHVLLSVTPAPRSLPSAATARRSEVRSQSQPETGAISVPALHWSTFKDRRLEPLSKFKGRLQARAERKAARSVDASSSKESSEGPGSSEAT